MTQYIDRGIERARPIHRGDGGLFFSNLVKMLGS